MSLVIEIDDDLFDQQAHDPLFGASISVECVPDPRQIMSETQQSITIDLWPGLDLFIQPADTSLQNGNTLERRVPARFQLARDVALGRVDVLVAALGEGHLIARFLELAFDRPQDMLLRLHGLLGRKQGRVHRRLGHGFEDLFGDRPVDPHAADSDAKTGADMRVVAPALIAMGVTTAHAVEHPHHPSAAAAAHEAGEQRAPTAPGLAGRAPLHVGVLQEHPLVLFEPLPVDVALMMIADQDVPLGHRLGVPGGLHRAAVDDAGPFAFAAESIGAGIERIVQDLHHAVVGRSSPLDPKNDAIAPDHRQLQGGVADPKEDLPRAAKLLELGEHQADDLLDPLVRVEFNPVVLAPDQTRRQREAERATVGFGVTCSNAPLAQKAETRTPTSFPSGRAANGRSSGAGRRPHPDR